MCGRFVQAYTWSELHEVLDILGPNRNLPARYNLAPTQAVDVILAQGEALELTLRRWGLVPGWWKKSLKEVPSTFNARAETLAEKPMFRTAFRRRRCIIPASGFYEWTQQATGKQPHYFSARSGLPLWMAGLWDEWTDPVSQDTLFSCSIIVTSANRFMRTFHDRMPVLLHGDDVRTWIFQGGGVDDLLRPAPEDLLQQWPVSRRVNAAARTDDAELIAPV